MLSIQQVLKVNELVRECSKHEICDKECCKYFSFCKKNNRPEELMIKLKIADKYYSEVIDTLEKL